ncbi:unnamed protein product [Cyclocybe aegerita]|uniref:Small ribosomal subunit protein bS18m n=1 Tax=Cyclocybe aegerita TaxID=1973307 RepID=A0A8S0XKV3_CYCAE|nr:unnamed protein product [Cyclocybe aegerita]
MSHLSNMLGGVDYQRPQSTQQQYKTTPWVKVQPHRVLRPTELSYNSRAKTYKPFAKYQVAPPPSIARGNDVFYRLNLDPRSFTMNPEVLYQFVSGMGKIYPREQTMLTAKSQRLLAKTIRRAKQMGVMANLSRPRSSF